MKHGRTWILLLGVALAFCAVAANADQALIVGVDTYPNLPKSADLEGAGVNSTALVIKALQAKGFQNPIVLTNEQATRQNILDKLDEIKQNIQPGERFVFYFLGHGDKALDRPVILPYDATMHVDSPDIDRDTLAQHLQAINAHARSVILDSCFSGAMMATAKDISVHKRKALFFYRPELHRRAPGDNSKEIIEVNNSDAAFATPGICYFTASDKTEQAYADEFDGKMYGVFTYFLIGHLNLEAARDERWGDVQRKVATDVADNTEDTQHPQLTDSYQKVVPFENLEGPTPDPKPILNLDELMNEDYNDPSQLKIDMNPNRTEVAVMEKFTFNAKLGSDGYLVILERGVSGNIRLIFPRSGALDDSKVQAGKSYRVPLDTKKSLAADRKGTERVKAFLFSSSEEADRLLVKFRAPGSPGDTTSVPRIRAGDIQEVPSDPTSFITYGVTFEVRPAQSGARR